MADILYKNKFKLLIWLCVFAYALILLPHHHHGEADRTCLNFTHCIDAEAGDHADHDAGASHKHDAEDDKCSVIDTYLVRVDREDARQNLLSNSYILLCPVFLVGAEEDACGNCYLDNILNLSIKQNTGVPPIYTAYIATAMPPRAPSFTA